MTEERSESVETCLKIPSGLFQEGATELQSVLCALLDAQLMFREPGLSLEQFEPLWNLCYPNCPLDGPIQSLCGMELVQITPTSVCALSPELCSPLAREMDEFLATQTIRLPHGDLTVGKLLDNFAAYYRNGPAADLPEESKPVKVWGGMRVFSSNRAHYVLVRPYPVLVRAHEESCILLLCSLPEAVSSVIADLFAGSRGLRHRVALFDPERGRKVNLTRSEVFVHFERFLKRVHGVRMGPDPMLTQSLLDAGLLSFDKG